VEHTRHNEAANEKRPARAPAADDFTARLLSASQQTLEVLLDDPRLEESHLCLLLERKDLTTAILERIAKDKDWLRSRRIRCGLVAHPHAPRRVALRLARELHLMDLVAISLRPTTPMEVRRFADEAIISRMRQLPLGQKLALARRASGRVAGALLTEGHERVSRMALDNSLLTEGQVLRALSAETLTANTLGLLACHSKWSLLPSVRAALARHPQASAGLVLPLLPDLLRRDLEDLSRVTRLAPDVRAAIRRELKAREHSD
jgi:hypothetical protein